MDSDALRRIQDAKLKRLEVLEEQAAALGTTAPPHILTERDTLRAELGFIDALTNPPIGSDVRRAMKRFDQLDLVVNVVAGLVQRVTAVEEAFARSEAQRPLRQQVLNVWLAAISIGVLYLVIKGL